jgi:predicted aspartyl protease
MLVLLPAVSTWAAEPSAPIAARSVGGHALIQLAGQPLSGGRSRGSVSLPLERAEGGHTPVLDFQVSGVRGTAGSRADAASPGHAPRQDRQDMQGARIRLLLDTGATSTMVTPELAERLALERRPLPPGVFALAGGGHGCADLQPQRSRLPALMLRDPAAAAGAPALSLEGVEALVLPVAALPAGVDGVLGAPSLRLMPIRIDPVLGRITLGAMALDGHSDGPNTASSSQSFSGSTAPVRTTLTPSSSSLPLESPSATTSTLKPSAPAQSRPQRLPLRWHRGVPLIALASSSGAVQALADTGAEGLFLQPALAARLRPLAPAEPLRLVGFCGEQRVERRRFAGLGLPARRGDPASAFGAAKPGTVAAGVEGIVTDNPIFQQLGIQAILGQELLRHHRQLWRLDQPRPELLLW